VTHKEIPVHNIKHRTANKDSKTEVSDNIDVYFCCYKCRYTCACGVLWSTWWRLAAW